MPSDLTEKPSRGKQGFFQSKGGRAFGSRTHPSTRPCEAQSAMAIQKKIKPALFFSGLPRTLTGARNDRG
jgi:hypothetical protein